MKKSNEKIFPRTRIATLDVMELGKRKHHITAILEIDVTDSRKKIRELRREKNVKISFTAWLIKTIASSLTEFPQVHSFLLSKRKIFIPDAVDISITVERKIDAVNVPLPYVIRNADKKTAAEITNEIERVKNKTLEQDEVVLEENKYGALANLYYFLPGILRRMIWKYFLLRPGIAHKNMGSVMLTSIAMMGKVNGWFIHNSIHPVSFGISSILKKPGVVENRIKIREFLNMTVLLDHDVIDGADMARFISHLSRKLENSGYST